MDWRAKDAPTKKANKDKDYKTAADPAPVTGIKSEIPAKNNEHHIHDPEPICRRHYATLTVLEPVNLYGPLVTACFTVPPFVNVIALSGSLKKHVSPSIV